MSLSSPIVIGLIVAIVVAILFFILFLVAISSKRKLKIKQKPNIKKRATFERIS